MQFSLDVSLGVAEQEVQAAISASGSLLPSDLPTPPVYRKVNPADVPILTLAVTSDSLPLPQVYDLVDKMCIRDRRSVAPDSAGSAVSQNSWFLDSMKPARSRLTTTTLHSIQMLNASISAGMEIHRLRDVYKRQPSA